MTDFVYDAEWWDQREQEVDEEYSGSNPFDGLVLEMRIQGTYIIRLLPPLGPKDIFRTYGEHWNIAAAEGAPRVIGCPKLTWGKSCPICEAADALIAQGYAEYNDIYGMGDGKFGVRKRSFMRVLLLKFTPSDPGKAVVLPELPAMKLMVFPPSLVKRMRDMAKGQLEMGSVDPMNTRNAMYHHQNGSPLRITKSEKIQNWYSCDLMRDRWPIPQQFLAKETWPQPEEYLPKTTTQEVIQILGKYRDDIPLLLSNQLERAGSIDLPSGGNQEALPPAGDIPPMRSANPKSLPPSAEQAPTPSKKTKVSEPWDDIPASTYDDDALSNALNDL